MFSVIIPLYNKEQSIGNTIQSVLNQTFKRFEIVIVNDGSTDNSPNIVETIMDDRIRLIHQRNQGVSAARNRAISEAKNDWIVFLDADDIWETNHLEILSELIAQYPRDRVFCTSFVKSNENPRLGNNSVIVIDNYFKVAIKDNFFWTSATCINKSVIGKVGGFDTRLSRGEDMELWTRIGRQYRFIKSNQITAVYRTDAENRSNLSFKLNESRLYHYNFSSSSTLHETAYYRSQVGGLLRQLIAKRDFLSFFKLFRKHCGAIRLRDVITK